MTLQLKSCWEIWDRKTERKVFDFAEEYKDFLGKVRTERLAVDVTRQLAKKRGFVEWDKFIQDNSELGPGDKVFATNREKISFW